MEKKWTEKIRQNEVMLLLDKYFPGESCGNPNCVEHYAELCKIAEIISLGRKEDILRMLAHQFVVLEHCPEQNANCPICRFSTSLEKCSEVFDNKITFADTDQIKYRFHSSGNGCNKCTELNGTIVTGKDLQRDSVMNSKGFYKQKDGVYRPHPNCKCYWRIQKEVINKPGLWQKYLPKIINGYQALEYAVIETVGSQAVSIGVDVVKIGTMIITDIGFFANSTRKIIFDYDNETKINCTEDLILLGELHKKNDWRGIARLHNKYVSLLKKRRN